ncbi:hypothetical protein ACK3TF_002648 [Chlorella vulgaris]
MQARGSLAALARLLATAEPSTGGPAALLVRSLCNVCPPIGASTAAARPSAFAAAHRHWQQGGSGCAYGWTALRQFSSGKQAVNEDAVIMEAVEDTLRPRVLRFFAFFMICGAGIKVLPIVAAQAVGNCLALLDAQQPFMVKAGCSRLQLLMRLEAGRQKAVEEGAARKLLRLMQRPDVEQGVIDYALSAISMLAGCDEGLQALAEAGGIAALEAWLAGVQRSPATEDAMDSVQQLLAVLSTARGPCGLIVKCYLCNCKDVNSMQADGGRQFMAEEEDLDAIWDDAPPPRRQAAPTAQAEPSSSDDSYFQGGSDNESDDSTARRAKAAEARLKDFGEEAAAQQPGAAALPSAVAAFTSVEGPPAFLDPEATRPLAVAVHREVNNVGAGGGPPPDPHSMNRLTNKRGQAVGEWDVSQMAPKLKSEMEQEKGVISGAAVRYRTDDRVGTISAGQIAMLGGQVGEDGEDGIAAAQPAGPAPKHPVAKGKPSKPMGVDEFMDKGVGGAQLPRKRQDRKDKEKDKRRQFGGWPSRLFLARVDACMCAGAGSSSMSRTLAGSDRSL